MRRQFVVDECVLEHALRGVDAHDRPNGDAAWFLISAAAICDQIVLDMRLRNHFYRVIGEAKQNARRGDMVAVLVLEALTKFRTTDGKLLERLENHDVVEDEERFPKEDRFLARLAYATGASIVSDEQGVVDAVSATPSLARAGVRGLRPADASAEMAQRAAEQGDR